MNIQYTVSCTTCGWRAQYARAKDCPTACPMCKCAVFASGVMTHPAPATIKVEENPAEVEENPAYGWYNAHNNIEAPIKPDLRRVPQAYGVNRDLVTSCGAVIEQRPQTDCLYYKQHSYDKVRSECRYLRFANMCDKVLLDETEVN